MGVVAQGLDAATMRFEAEANPIVVALGPSAYLAKIALILLVTPLALVLPRLEGSWPRARTRAARLLISSLLGAGMLGTLSNLAVR